jgi:hypothetical protein
MKADRKAMACLCFTLAFGATAVAQGRDVDGWMKSAHFIVGVYNVEDMIQLPETRWIIGSGLTTLGPGEDDQVITQNYLHVFDAETETVRQVEPENIAVKANTAEYFARRREHGGHTSEFC